MKWTHLILTTMPTMNRPFPSSLVPLFEDELKGEIFHNENVFYTQFEFSSKSKSFS